MAHASAVTTIDFETEVIHSAIPVAVDFWATWCGPCKQIAPHVEALAEEYAGKVKIVKVNIDDDQDIANKYGILSIPTLLFFKDGKVVGQHVGAAPKKTIAERIEALL